MGREGFEPSTLGLRVHSDSCLLLTSSYLRPLKGLQTAAFAESLGSVAPTPFSENLYAHVYAHARIRPTLVVLLWVRNIYGKEKNASGAIVNVEPGGATAGGFAPTGVTSTSGTATMGVAQYTTIGVAPPEPGLHPPPDSSLFVVEGLTAGLAVGAVYVVGRVFGESLWFKAMNEERSPAKPDAGTKKPIVANPSTPGIQTSNKPDGRDAPPATESR